MEFHRFHAFVHDRVSSAVWWMDRVDVGLYAGRRCIMHSILFSNCCNRKFSRMYSLGHNCIDFLLSLASFHFLLILLCPSTFSSVLTNRPLPSIKSFQSALIIMTASTIRQHYIPEKKRLRSHLHITNYDYCHRTTRYLIFSWPCFWVILVHQAYRHRPPIKIPTK